MINFRGGKALIKKSLYSFMSSRGFFWTLSTLWMMAPLVYLFVWIAAVGKGPIGGFSKNDFIFYYICIILINQLTYPTSNWVVGDNIRNGTFSTWLTQPLPIIYRSIAQDLAVKIVCMPFIIIISVILIILLGPTISFNLANLWLFVISLVFAQVIRFMLAYVLALLAIWNQRSDALLTLNDTLVFFFSGQIAPVALLPGLLKTIAYIIPFRYMIGFPVEILVGRINFQEILIGLCIQVLWLIIILLGHQFIWKKAIRHYSAIGG